MAEEATQEAAARLAESLIVDMAQSGNENALEIIRNAQAEAPAEPAVEAAAPEAEAPAEAPEPVEPVNFNPDLPDDLKAELDAAEIDEEVEAEVAAYVPEPDEWGNPGEVDEEAVRQRIKLQKENEYLKRQLTQSNASKWRAEAEQYMPLSKHALDDIAKQATSRRHFLRLAKAEHDRILPHVQAYLADAKTVVDAETNSATDTARAAVADAWGQPLVDPSTALNAPAVQREDRLTKAREDVRQGAPLRKLFAELLKP